MREIKFRVWDKSRRAMGVLNEIKYAKNMYTQVKYTMVIKGKPVDEWSSLDENFYGTCALMQYTGLKDKNGVKIFEGDIVKCTDGADEISKLNSDTGIGKIEWLEEWGFWSISNIENGLGDISNNGYVEVIGNIYENPELLEEGKP